MITAIEFEEGVDELAQAQMVTLPSLRPVRSAADCAREIDAARRKSLKCP